MKNFLTSLNEKIIVFDGAMGTNIQLQNLSADDFGGEHFNGCNENLIFTKPDTIEKIHASFFEVGVDVVETNTFGSSSIVLSEYGLEKFAYEMNFKSAQLAKKVAMQFSKISEPKYVAGSIGPSTKLPSLGHIKFDEMQNSYYEQVAGLVEGGVDLLIVETCQDVLQIKSCLGAIQKYFEDKKIRLPIITSFTIETMGTMLMGTEVAAVLTSLEPYGVDVIGMNCAMGPKEMSDHLRFLSQNSPIPISCIPNAGLPENVGGHAHYHLTPDEFANWLTHFVKDFGINVVGGCCGTRPDHLKELVNRVSNITPVKRKFEFASSVSSIYSASQFVLNPGPFIIGERTNANGSKKFRDLLQKNDLDGMVEVAKDEAKEGSHAIDVCVAYVGRDEVKDMTDLIFRLNTQVQVPLVFDSTEVPVIEAALKLYGGKSIINSINLEDGEERLNKILSLCKKFGAAVIALTIDEDGMAKSAEKKLEIARRIYNLYVNNFQLNPENLIFDTLTFTLGSGDEEFRKAGIETLEAIKLLKKEFPKVQTILGISNISFGLAPNIRQTLNSVFLHYSMEAGLSSAIVNPKKIIPLYKIDEKGRELCRQLIFDERKFENEICVFDPLIELINYFADKKSIASKTEKVVYKTIEEKLKHRIIDGNKLGLVDDLNEALQKYSALEIINTILLDGMKVVGDLFGRGEMQLPFVLQSAETMKSSVLHLEQFMEKLDTTSKGTLVLATVKGDVHDIGKNLVDIILTNNGYKVYNLGIKQPIENILKTFNETKADAIGMSGLLVKSTLVMKENLEVLNERNIKIPIVLGGAALTRRYVENDLRSLYKGTVVYATDAFDGLRFMEKLKSEGENSFYDSITVDANKIETFDEEDLTGSEAKISIQLKEPQTSSSSFIDKNVQIPKVPFYGAKIVENIALDEVYKYINEAALIKGQWRVRKGKLSEEEYQKVLKEKIYPELNQLKEFCKTENLLNPKVVYGYYPCQSNGNDLIIYEEDEKTEKLRFTFPRQKGDRKLCLSDYFSSVTSKKIDVVSFQLVTAGSEASKYSAKLFSENRYKDYLYFHGLSVESAEALAELWHKKIREELNIAEKDSKEIKKLFSQNYQGSRYSFGYPACPNLEDHKKLFELLKPERIGITLTEEFMIEPEQSTDAIIVHHSQAKYFNV
ncbi:MAG: methionine synthase [Bacteroidetes bacterium]|nr:methionine synthase [Bacteroidota bacterium]